MITSKPCIDDYQERNSHSNGGFVSTEVRVWKRRIENDASWSWRGDLAWVPLKLSSRGTSIYGIQSIRICSPFNPSCSLCDKQKVCEGIVLKNIKVRWIGEVFGVTSELGLWVLFCLFKLNLWNDDYSVGIFFPNNGVGGHCHKCPTYFPLLAICPFLVQNRKMVGGSTNQFCNVFGGDCQGWWAWLKKTFLPLLLHVYIWFYWKDIILFIFIIRFQYLESGVNWKLIIKDDIKDFGCTKFHVLPNIFFLKFNCYG